MSYYKIPTDCPKCGTGLSIHTLGIGTNWALAANWTCPKCKAEGGIEYDLCELTLEARRHESNDITYN